ncbi:hypothetical protein JCM11491_006222 [Sporobolomyces phaffii]
MAPLAPCDYAHVESSPSENKVASKEEIYSERLFAFSRWRQVRPVYRQIQFLRKLSGTVRVSPQPSRVLINETDAKEAYCFNVLTPLVEIANKFIAPHLRQHFEVQLFAEYPIEINKRATDRGVPAQRERHDLVSNGDWTHIDRSRTRPLDAVEEHTIVTMLPQLLMYVHLLRCRRIVLTDYSDTVTCDIDENAFEQLDKAIPLSFRAVSNRPDPDPAAPRDLSSFGPRLALAFELYEGLKGLGLLPSHAYSEYEPRKLDVRTLSASFSPPTVHVC